MCVANLNVSTQSCNHRWYTLARSCSSQTDLSNCSEKLKLQGWETRQDSCPWCDDDHHDSGSLDDSTHRLFGGSHSRPRSGSFGSSPPAPMNMRNRRTSSATNSTTSLSRSSTVRSVLPQDLDDDSQVLGLGEKARMMNWRLDVYLLTNKGRPQQDYSAAPVETAPEPVLQRTNSLRRSSSLLGKKMKKSMRLSKSIFKG